MRKLPAILTVLGLSAAALTGCSVLSVEGDQCERDVFEQDTASFAEVSGAFGEVPEADVDTPVRVSETSYVDLVSGDGTPLSDPQQLAVIDFALFHGETGEQIIATSFLDDLVSLSNVEYWSNQIPALGGALDCASEGTRTLVAISPEGLGEPARQGLNIGAGESVLAVVDVRKAYLPHAEGQLQFNAGVGLPSVVRAPDGRPGVIIPDADPPAELITQVLIKGAGEVITADTPFRVHYTGLTWADRSVFDSSWGDVSPQFSLDSLVDGVSTALEGQTVGSQVMVVVPPELGYGDTPQSGIPAGSTLVFVFDILGIDAVAAQ